jgi:TolA-binding protein
MSFTHWQASRTVIAALVLAGGAVIAAPAAAQADDARLRKIEAEIRALQRQVFPDGDGRFFTPEVVTPDGSRPQQTIGTPSESAVTDILARLQAMESQLAQLTARSEENANEIRLMEERLGQLESAGAPPPAAQQTGAIRVPNVSGGPAPTAGATPGPSAATPAAGPSPERLARVQAITKPATGDAGEDEYTYGFRLWEAGLFPEAQQQLKLFVERYPSHRMVSYGRNLLGRAYLDDGQPRLAAPYFLENYQSDPGGARAPDSLLYLANAMIALEDTTRACRALAEFSEKYPALATGRLRDQYDKDRRSVTCG